MDTTRAELGEMPITGTVVIGEGQKDEAPELYVGEVLGRGGMECEIAVNPLEGTDLVARGDSGAVAICAIGEPGGPMPAPDIYMQKLVVGATARGRVSIDDPIAATLDVVARCYGRALRDTTAIALDRPRPALRHRHRRHRWKPPARSALFCGRGANPLDRDGLGGEHGALYRHRAPVQLDHHQRDPVVRRVSG